ncbi:MAG: hypothetical protein EA397_07665 [Deltaproteobacteria bacterium]|nr:MAG: hypothetical protein EA397_07665 [Deltaproteobacteria bacterium]
MLLLFVGFAFAHLPLPDGLDAACGTPHFWAPAQVGPPTHPPPPNQELLDRDPYGVPGELRSEHFVVRFGQEQPTDPEARQRLIDALELSWIVQVDEWGHTPPAGTDTHRLNVYIGDTGDGAPPGYGTGGYFTADSEGWPMIVVSAATLQNPDFADITASHELYHAVQSATQRYTYEAQGVGSWFWEASATWASAAIYPENQSYHVFLVGYAFHPHRALNFFRYPRDGVLEELYQYGAFIWPLFLQQRLGTVEPLIEAWEIPVVGGDDPLEALRIAVEGRGYDLDELWLEHIARNATWDYPNGAQYRRNLAAYAQTPESANLVAADLPRLGFDGSRQVPIEHQPERYGSVRLSMLAPRDGEYTLMLRGTTQGTHGSEARWGGHVVLTPTVGEPEYVPIPFEGPFATLDLTDLHGYQRADVVVGAWTPELGPFWRTETFPLRYWLSYEAPDPADALADVIEPESVRARGCQSAAGSVPGWLGLVASLLLWIPRQRLAVRANTTEGRRQNQ